MCVYICVCVKRERKGVHHQVRVWGEGLQIPAQTKPKGGGLNLNQSRKETEVLGGMSTRVHKTDYSC